jgi:hypothetical protein
MVAMDSRNPVHHADGGDAGTVRSGGGFQLAEELRGVFSDFDEGVIIAGTIVSSVITSCLKTGGKNKPEKEECHVRPHADPDR